MNRDYNLINRFTWMKISSYEEILDLVTRVHIAFYLYIKGYIVPGNQVTHNKLTPKIRYDTPERCYAKNTIP